jgi:hypothetical protein
MFGLLFFGPSGAWAGGWDGGGDDGDEEGEERGEGVVSEPTTEQYTVASTKIYWDKNGSPCVVERSCPGCGQSFASGPDEAKRAVLTDGVKIVADHFVYYDGGIRVWAFDLEGLAPGRLSIRCECGHPLTLEPWDGETRLEGPGDDELDAVIDRARALDDPELRAMLFDFVTSFLYWRGVGHFWIWIGKKDGARLRDIWRAAKGGGRGMSDDEMPDFIRGILAENAELKKALETKVVTS